MTDGILLAELQSDRMLRQYDTLIIDEAHERSLNIDFILGYLKRLLPRRPDLKVIITSATIDPERFSRHFDDAPIVEVSGRTYPVEVRYRPIVDPDDPDADPDRDQTQAILDAVDELSAEGPGDVLVFLSGEREIRDTADALVALEKPGLEILPLYARLSSGEQRRVFQRHRGRRVVLATNVAETSLTVPGIKYVIDPGFARISRYSNRLKVQRLPIEPISQASANQRKGRCGRTSDGICIRLYAEDDFDARPEFTDPEILRTNLASVILQMAAADLGDIAEFPFVEPPDRRHITDGMNLLHELGALETSTKDTTPRLTPLGRKLARLPVDPRLARMVLEADQNGCVSEVTVIAAALSIQDPRERPADKQAQADQQHARFRDPESDFMSYLKLWEYLTEQKRDLSANRFRKLCRAEFLNYLRVREWQDVAGQLKQMTKSLDVVPNETPAEPEAVHMVAARRPAVAHRPEGRREARLPRRPQRAVRHLPRLGAVQEAAALGDGRRAGGDHPAVGPDRGPHRTGLDRAARRPPGAPHLQRAAVGEEARRGDGVRAGHAARRADRRGPCGELRPHRPAGRAGAVHPARAGAGGVGEPARVPGAQRRAARRGRGAGAQGAAPGHRRRRGDAVPVLRPARRPGRRVRPALRHVVEEDAARAARAADVHARPAGQPRDRGERAGLSRMPCGTTTSGCR